MANENIIARKGVKIILRDDKEYTILPLTLNQLIEIWPTIQKLESKQDDVTADLLKDMIDVAHLALRREVEKDKVGDLVDLVDLQTIIATVVGQSKETMQELVQKNQ